MTNDPKGPSTDETRIRAQNDGQSYGQSHGQSHGQSGASGAGPAHNGGRPSGQRDVLGLALLVASAFCGVAVVLAYADPKPDAQGLTGWVMGLVGVLGIASMFLSAGLGWIGYRLWIRGIDGKLVRDLFGVVITTFTLAILVGALSPDLGGRVGAIGGLVSHQLTVFVGLIFGLMVVLLPAWFLWLRPAALAAGELPQSSAPAKLHATDSSGVTAAEADALLPKPPASGPKPSATAASADSKAPRPTPAAATAPTVPTAPKAPTPKPAPSAPQVPASKSPEAQEKAAKRETTLEGAVLSPSKVFAPSPYPPDVRREGRVPDGARPLESGPTAAPRSPATPTQPPPTSAAPAALLHELRHESVPAQDSRDASALRTVGDGAVHERAAASPERHGHAEPTVAEAIVERDAAHGAGRAVSDVAAHGDRADASAQLGAAKSDAAKDDDATARASASALPLERTPPKPSWEQPEMFEEPVDAYGTPLSLVAALRQGETPPVVATNGARSQDAADENTMVDVAAIAARDLDDADLDEKLDGELDGELDDSAALDSVRPFAQAPAQGEDESDADDEARVDVKSAAWVVETVVDPAREEAVDVQSERDELRAELRGWIEGAGEATEAAVESGVEEDALGEGELEAQTAAATAAAAAELAKPKRSAEVVTPSVAQAREERDVATSLANAIVVEAPTGSDTEAPLEPRVADVAKEAVTEVAVESAPKPSGSKAPPKIRSLFGDDEPAPTALDHEPEVVAPQAEPAGGSVEANATDSSVDAELDEVVLEPAKKSKRKSKASTAREPQAAPTGPEVTAKSEDAPEGAARELEVVGTEDEPDVELTPAKPGARSAVSVDEVVFKAGCLFVERQRVAVSMLQREFGLDFDAATSVLDQLQRAGLIGPYLGGQRRDILLSLEEWRNAVAVE